MNPEVLPTYEPGHAEIVAAGQTVLVDTLGCRACDHELGSVAWWCRHAHSCGNLELAMAGPIIPLDQALGL